MLQIKSLNKSFDKKRIFKDFSFDFDSNGIYLIKGKSGVGKTTLLRIISGLDKEFKGEVVGGGIDNVSYCFQEYRLFATLSALENITEISFNKANPDEIEASKKMLKRLGFSDDDFALFPSELSGGMRQRVAFIRAVMKKSPILILDEPTKEVDGAIREEMIKIIKELSNDRLILMVTHNTDDFNDINAKTIIL